MADTPGLDIINLALNHIAGKPITQTQLNDNSVPATQAALRSWAFALKETLRINDWGFARVVEELTVLADADYESEIYEYAYVRPTSCLAIRRIFNSGTSEKTIGEKFSEEHDVTNGLVRIVTDCSDAYIRYTYYVTDTDLYDSSFVNAFSHRLAAEIAMPLNGDREIAKAEITIFNNQISEAQRHASYENNETHEANEKANFVDARG